MLLWIASWQIEHIGIRQLWHLSLRVETSYYIETVEGFLIDKGECLGIPGYDDCLFPAWERDVPSMGTRCSQRGNIEFSQPFPADMLLYHVCQLPVLCLFREIKPQVA